MTSRPPYYDVTNLFTMTSRPPYYDVTNPATMTSLTLLLLDLFLLRNGGVDAFFTSHRSLPDGLDWLGGFAKHGV